MSADSDPDPKPFVKHNGPSNDDVEKKTWDWFTEAVGILYGPAHYQLLPPTPDGYWPDVIALRAHDRVGFEITSPLRPDDVVKRPGNGDNGDEELSAQARLEQRVVEALKRKIKKYGNGKTQDPLALLITLAHPSSLKFYSHIDLKRLSGIVRGHLTNFLHQPLDAVYLVGPGARAHLLWRRRGPKWKKLFPDLDGK